MDVDTFRRWYRYERDVHALTLGSLETVPEERRGDSNFQRCIDLLAHLVAARRMWLGRFGVLAETPPELFPLDNSLEHLRRELEATESTWTAYLERLEPCGLEAWFEYTAFEGGRFKSRIGDVLTQLFGHSWYHRGQIAQLVRALGGEPAVTDFVYWSREPQDAGQDE